jgi:hypothetical protein
MAQSPEQKSLRDYLNGGSAHNSVVFFQGEDYGLQLRDNEYQGMSDTDALFHFNADREDLSQNYEVIGGNPQVSHRFARLGGGSLVFQQKGGLQLEAQPGSLFLSRQPLE